MGRPSFKSEISLGATIQIVVVLFAVTAGWFKYTNGVENNANAVADVSSDIALVKLAYVKADEDLQEAHNTTFARIDTRFDRVSDEVDEVKDDTSSLAVSLGKLEAGQTYIQNSLEQLLEISQ